MCFIALLSACTSSKSDNGNNNSSKETETSEDHKHTYASTYTYDNNGINEFLTYNQLNLYILSKDNLDTIKRFEDTFNGKNVYYNFSGIPNSFNSIINKYKTLNK